MTKEFEDFLSQIRFAEKRGTIKTSKPLSDFDLAVTFAVDKIGEIRGAPCNATIDEIHAALLLFCGADVYETSKGEVNE